MLLLVVVVGAVLFLSCYWSPKRRLRDLAEKIPGPTCVPILGNALVFWGTTRQVFDNVMRMVEDFGPVVRAWLVNRLYVILTDPDDIEQVIGNSHFINKDSVMIPIFQYFIGNGILGSVGETWKKQRKTLTPLFHLKVIRSHFKIFSVKSKVLRNRLNRVANGPGFDINHFLSSFTLDSICETVIGVPGNTQTKGENTMQLALHRILHDAVMSRISKPWLYNDRIYEWTAEGKEFNKLKKLLRKFAEDIVEKKLIEHREGLQKVRKGFVTSSGKTIYSLLDTIISTSESQETSLSTEEIVDFVLAIAVAGQETAAVTMSFFLIYVAIHPEIQEQIFQELKELLPDTDGVPKMEDIPKLEVLDRALKETMRLMPAVSSLLRDIDRDVELPSGFIIPKGSSVAALPYMVHRNPKYYSQPERFWPDRWLPKNRAQHARAHACSYIPFGVGPRNCIGQRYATLEMKCVLSVILRSFFVQTEHTMGDMDKLDIGITFSSSDGNYFVQIERR